MVNAIVNQAIDIAVYPSPAKVRRGFLSPRHLSPEGLSLRFGQPKKSPVFRRVLGRGVDLAGPGMPEILSLGAVSLRGC